MSPENPMTRCLVFDLGAGSGRAMLAELSDGRISLREVHRFSGYEVRLEDGPAWDVETIRTGIRAGLAKAAAIGPIASVAVDSWGVDFALLDASGDLVDQPRTHRHPRGADGMAALAPYNDRIAERTGLQILPIATVFHASEWARNNPEKLAKVRHFLMTADFYAHELSGVVACEKTIARTSGFLSINGEEWDRDVIDWCGLPSEIFGRIVEAATVLGPLRPELVTSDNLAKTQVVATAGHDTACAAFALAPAAGEAFASCGSWVLLGADVPDGRMPDNVHAGGFGLEGGIGGRAILTRSLPGLFLLRRLRDSWKRRTGGDVDFATIGAMALAADPATPAIDVSDPLFFDPTDLVAAMEQHRPILAGQGIGVFARSLYLGLARATADGAHQLGKLTSSPIHTIRVGGGGSQDAAWKRFLEDESGCRVVAGPVEASVVGSALIQFVALGAIPSFAAAHDMARGGIGMEPVAP